MSFYEITSICLLLLLIFGLRGGLLHNYLVLEADKIFRQAGFKTHQEHPQSLPDGRMDFIDLFVQREKCMICIEIETSARNVRSNAIKADQIGLPLMVIVPNRKVQKAVQNKIDKARITAGGLRIYVLLLDQLQKEVMNCFPVFSLANTGRKNKKTNQK